MLARSVLHIAHQPLTGVWSMMRQLGLWQIAQGYRVGFGLMLQPDWPTHYRQQIPALQQTGLEVRSAPSPAIFGTGAHLYHQALNPVPQWLDTFSSHGTDRVIVHFHNAWLSGAYMPLRNRQAVGVVTYHGIQGERALRRQPLRRRLHRYWAWRSMRHALRHVSVDAHNTAVAERLFGIDRRSFAVIPNGTVAAPAGVSGCPRLTQPTLPFTVGHVGYIDQGKGWRITARAVEQLHGEGFDVRLLIAGSGPEARLAQDWCAANPGFARYLGHVSAPSVDVYPYLDALSLPSMSEGLPMAALEAFAFAIPVVGTAAGGLAEAIVNGVNGNVVERAPGAVAAALRRLIVEPAHHAALSQGAGQTHRSRYSVTTMGQRYDALYSGSAL